jgi:hypothetical protein
VRLIRGLLRRGTEDDARQREFDLGQSDPTLSLRTIPSAAETENLLADFAIYGSHKQTRTRFAEFGDQERAATQSAPRTVNLTVSDLVQNAKTVPIRDLTPTQVTVGMREVDIKRQRWREKHSHGSVNYLNKHRLPVILGPNARHYLIDRHHLTLALYDEGVSELPVLIVANLSGYGFDEFWKTLEDHHWTHPFDDQGRRRSYYAMPTAVDALIDDPFRSLAGQEGWWIHQGQSAFQ